MKNFFLHFAFELQRRRQAPSDVVQHQPKWKKLIKKKLIKMITTKSRVKEIFHIHKEFEILC